MTAPADGGRPAGPPRGRPPAPARRLAFVPAQPGGAEAHDDGRHALRREARRVLLGNWTGTSTVPSHGLYPHQWSWDSAFIAIGLRRLSATRAQRELETLFAAQWADGRVPHIVFHPSVPLGAYFPSPDFWRSSTAGAATGAPRLPQTSGIVQPPVHALAAWLVHEADPDASRRRGFLRRLYPRLAAWHRYLTEQRNLGGGGLASVVHPWEPGMDNSPCWDGPLSRVEPAPAGSFRRADLDHGTPPTAPPTSTTAATCGSPPSTATAATVTPAARPPSPWRTRASTRCSSPPRTRSPASRPRSAPTRARTAHGRRD